MWTSRSDWMLGPARVCADSGRPGLSLTDGAELGERFIAESPWFYETAAVWSRSPSADRVTTVLLKAPTSHAFREMKFIVSQL